MSAEGLRPLSALPPPPAPARAETLPPTRARPATPAPAARARPWVVADLVAQLRGVRAGERVGRVEAVAEAVLSEKAGALGRHALPSRDALVAITNQLRAALFPAHFGGSDLTSEGMDYFVGRTLDTALQALQEQVRRGLHFACAGEGDVCARCDTRAIEVIGAFGAALPAIRALLESDVHAAYEGDPAATSLDEAVFCYPGIAAITHHRLAHQLHTLGVPLIPRIISEISHGATGIDIHPGAEIGASFFIDHGTGVVIGETCLIGERVRIYQGVTLGARSFDVDERGRLVKGASRHPIVEDDVVIYAGATILGRITIGRGTSVGGNVWLTRSVPARSRVTQAQAHSAVFEDGSGI
jgi:serine O-acetyltransferase